MTTTNFSAGTVVESSWLNDVDEYVYGNNFVVTGTGSVARTLVEKARETVSVADFGAVGDGTTNDLTAFTNALAAHPWIKLESGKTYFLGDISTATPLFLISGENKGIDFNGGKVVVNTTSNVNAPIFQLDNIDGFTLIAPDIEDTGYDDAIDFRGASVVRLKPIAGPVRNIHITRAKFKTLVSPLDCTSAAQTAENIWFDGDCYSTYYGISLTSNGHNLTADYRTFDVIRSYFCAGVKNHQINCVSTDHNSRGNADFLCKVYQPTYPTRNIRARFTSVNSQATTNPQLVFESQNDTGTTIIEDIEVYYNDLQSTGVTQSVAFRHFSEAGVLQATDPNTKNRINVSGYVRGTIVHSSAPTTQQDQYFDRVFPRSNFSAFKSSASTNATGNGTVVDVVFDTETDDDSTTYDATTGIFTAQRPGVYSFAAQVLVIAKTAAVVRTDIRVVTTSVTYTNTASVTSSTNYPEHTLSINVPRHKMAAGDTAKVQVVVYNGAGNTATIYGDSTIRFTYFQGGIL